MLRLHRLTTVGVELVVVRSTNTRFRSTERLLRTNRWGVVVIGNSYSGFVSTFSTNSGGSNSSSSGNSDGTSKKIKLKTSATDRTGDIPVDRNSASEVFNAAHVDGKERQSTSSGSSSGSSIRSFTGNPISSSNSSGNSSSKSKSVTSNLSPYQQAMFATKVGAVANVCLAVSKCVVGFSINSTALIADAANSLGDLLTDIVVYYTVAEARKKATPDRPWGTGKIEPLGALVVGGLLLTTGLGIGYSALYSFMKMMLLTQDLLSTEAAVEIVNNSPDLYVGTVDHHYDASDSFEHNDTKQNVNSTVDDGPNSDSLHSFQSYLERVRANLEKINESASNSFVMAAALTVSGLSIGAKEALFRYTLKAGTKANSAAVVANAWQHRADVGTSLAVFGGLLGSMAGFPLLDPFAALLVSGVIIRQAFVTSFESLKDLSDAPASARETEQLRTTCMSVKGIISVEEIRARKSGPFLYVEVKVGVLGTISASAAHRLAELTRLELLRVHRDRVAAAVVHADPLGSAGLGELSPARDYDEIVSEIKRVLETEEEIRSVSEVQVYYKDNGRITAKADIVLRPDLTIGQAHAIAVNARKMIEKSMPNILEDIDIDLELDETDDQLMLWKKKENI